MGYKIKMQKSVHSSDELTEQNIRKNILVIGA